MDPRQALALILGACVCFAAHAELFKCVQPGGKVVYQDSKCPDEAKQSTVRPPDERAAAPITKDAAPGTKTDGAPAAPLTIEAVIEVLANFQGCVEQFPAFAAKYGAAFQQWRQKNMAALTRYEQDSAARRKVRESIDFQRQQAGSESAEGRADKADICDKVIGPLVEGKPAQAR